MLDQYEKEITKLKGIIKNIKAKNRRLKSALEHKLINSHLEKDKE
jgi:hypothetical protein